MAQKVILKKSNQTDKIPSATTMEFGEVYVNYASGNGKSFLATRKSDDTIAQFMEKTYTDSVINELSACVISNELVISMALNDINDKIQIVSEMEQRAISGNTEVYEIISKLSGSVIDNEIIISSALIDLNEKIGILQQEISNLKNGL